MSPLPFSSPPFSSVVPLSQQTFLSLLTHNVLRSISVLINNALLQIIRFRASALFVQGLRVQVGSSPVCAKSKRGKIADQRLWVVYPCPFTPSAEAPQRRQRMASDSRPDPSTSTSPPAGPSTPALNTALTSSSTTTDPPAPPPPPPGSRKRSQKFKRSRAGCLACRKIKQRCDELKPVCVRCSISGKEVRSSFSLSLFCARGGFRPDVSCCA